jgi:adenylosuccinate synthase
VGSGPFPTESDDAAGDLLRREGNEYGAVTGRPRRCGWFDVPLLAYTAMVNGFDSIMMTKLDVLDQLEEIPVCVRYRLNGAEICEMPATYRALEAVEPVYETLPGWRTSTRGISRYEALPRAARDYLEFLENRTGVEIGGISTGPERSETIIREGSELERLIS